MISICIPTCNRLPLLKVALSSCLEQGYRPLEILIGDDSASDETGQWIAGLAMPAGVALRYERQVPPLGQSANVNRLFDRARGERLLLLHDDDLLYPGGLDRLDAAWRAAGQACCVYGRQTLIDVDGALLPAETLAWSERYIRTAGHAGEQPSRLVAALRQQVPNNAYLIAADTARRVRYRPETEIGQCVDAEFILRLAMSGCEGSFLFVDEVVSAYRLNPLSIARSHANRRQDLFFRYVQSIRGGADVDHAKAILLERISAGAALDAAKAHRRRLALAIIFSRYYLEPKFSRWTAYRLASVASPRAADAVKALVDPFFRARRKAGAAERNSGIKASITT